MRFETAFGPLLIVLLVPAWSTVRPAMPAECAGVSPCESLKISTHVFVADVESATSGLVRISPREEADAPQIVRAKVVEAFKGLKPDQRELEFRNFTHSSEIVRFEAGKRYLVYVKVLPDGQWSTMCSRTRMLQDANRRTRDDAWQIGWEDELQLLRTKCGKLP